MFKLLSCQFCISSKLMGFFVPGLPGLSVLSCEYIQITSLSFVTYAFQITKIVPGLSGFSVLSCDNHQLTG